MCEIAPDSPEPLPGPFLPSLLQDTEHLVAVVPAFSCVTLLLILFLLALKKVIQAFMLHSPVGCLGSMLADPRCPGVGTSGWGNGETLF